MYLAYDTCMAWKAVCVFILWMYRLAFLETMEGWGEEGGGFKQTEILQSAQTPA